MAFQPSRTSLGDPNLPSPTAFMSFLCFFASSARKDQAGTLCLLAGHGGGAEESQGRRSSVATPSTNQG